MVPLLPVGMEPEEGGAQQNAHGHDSRNGGGVHSLPGEFIHLPQHGVVHGVVYARTGKQGENCHDQIGNGRVLPDSRHGFRIDRGKQSRPEITDDIPAAQAGDHAVKEPGQHTPQGADGRARAVDVEENGKTNAADEGEQALEPHGIGDAGSGYRHPPQNACHIPGTGGAQGNGGSQQKHLDNAVHTGIGVAVENVPHGVGEGQSRHQNHQGADVGGIGVGAEPGGVQTVGQQGHKEGRGQGIEERSRPAGTENGHDKPHQQSAKTGAQSIHKAAAEEQGKASAAQKISQSPDQGRIDFHRSQGVCQLPLSRPRVGTGFTDTAAEGTEAFQSVQVISVVADAPHSGDRRAVGQKHGDSQIIGDGKNLGVEAVGRQNPADAFLHPEGFRSAHGQLIAQITGKINQCNFFHGNPLYKKVGNSIPYSGKNARKNTEEKPGFSDRRSVPFLPGNFRRKHT